MARNDDYYDDYEIEPASGYDINDVLWNDNSADPRAMELFDSAFFNGDKGAYQDLIDYLWDNYEIDFEDVFDWEDFREWYDAA